MTLGALIISGLINTGMKRLVILLHFTTFNRYVNAQNSVISAASIYTDTNDAPLISHNNAGLYIQLERRGFYDNGNY